MGEKPTGATVPTLGDMWMSLNAMYRRLAEMEERLREVEQDCRYVKVEGLKSIPRREADWLEGNSDPPPVWTGSIQGLEGEWTVTPPPEFGGA